MNCEKIEIILYQYQKMGMLCEIMKGKSRRSIHDLRLKIAIVESRKTQRRIALDTRIGEIRLSQIVGYRGMPATTAEKQRLATYLGRQVADLFPTDDGGLDAEQVPREEFGTSNGPDQR